MTDDPAGTTAPPPKRWSRVAVPYSALRLGGQAGEFAGWVLLARKLGTSGFGELSIVFLLCRYAGIVADWGAAMRGPRDVVDARRGSIHAYVRLRAAIAFGLATVGAVVLLALGRWELVPVVAVTLSLGLSRDWVALGREQGARAAVPIFGQGAVIAVAALAMPAVSGGAAVVGLGYGFSAVLSVAINRVPRDLDRGRGRIDAWMLAAVLANQITSSLDTVLLGILASASAAGIYAAVYRIPNAWIAVLGAVLAGLLPVATRALNEDEDRFRQLRSRSMRMSGAAALVVLVCAPIGAYLVPVAFGDAYRSGRPAVVILLVATAVITLASPLHPLAVSGGSDRTYALILVSGAALNLAANLALIPRFGMTGAASSTLLSQVCIGIALWILVNHQAASRAGPASVSRMKALG